MSVEEKETTPLSRGQRFVKRMAGLFDLDVIRKKISQEPMAEYLFSPKAEVRRPKVNYALIYDELVKSWVFRQISRAITQEVINPEMELMKKFSVKCMDCGTEYEFDEEECQECHSINLRKPDEDQRKIAQKLVDSPNPNYSFKQLMRSALLWHLMLDDTYLSVAYKNLPQADGTIKRVPSEVYCEDTRFTFPVADALGNLGNDEYFCPICYSPMKDNHHKPDENWKDLKCPECKKLDLIQTTYVMQIQDTTKYRFGRKEIVMDSTDRTLPSLFGNPKSVSVWKQIQTINNMDDYNEEVYSEGNTGGIIAFPGMSKDAVTSMKKDIQKEISAANHSDVVTGKREKSRKIHTVMVGVREESPELIEVMPDPAKMQSLDFYKLYRDSICSVFGVTPIFVSVIESGRSGNNPRMQIDVQKGTTEENQQFLSDMWNSKVFGIFGVYDWEVVFGSIEAVDELREAQIWEHKADAMKTLTELGFEVSLDEQGNLEVSREPEESLAEPEGDGDGTTDENVSEESGDWLMDSPTKKGKKGKRKKKEKKDG